MPKGKKGSKKNNNIEPDICDDEHFDEDLRIVYIEYGLDCPIFKQQAQEFIKLLNESMVDMKLKIFENRPRNGSFEIKVARNCRLPVKQIWSGIEKEPREDKFPKDMNDLLKTIKTVLK